MKKIMITILLVILLTSVATAFTSNIKWHTLSQIMNPSGGSLDADNDGVVDQAETCADAAGTCNLTAISSSGNIQTYSNTIIHNLRPNSNVRWVSPPLTIGEFDMLGNFYTNKIAVGDLWNTPSAMLDVDSSDTNVQAADFAGKVVISGSGVGVTDYISGLDWLHSLEVYDKNLPHNKDHTAVEATVKFSNQNKVRQALHGTVVNELGNDWIVSGGVGRQDVSGGSPRYVGVMATSLAGKCPVGANCYGLIVQGTTKLYDLRAPAGQKYYVCVNDQGDLNSQPSPCN